MKRAIFIIRLQNNSLLRMIVFLNVCARDNSICDHGDDWLILYLYKDIPESLAYCDMDIALSYGIPG